MAHERPAAAGCPGSDHRLRPRSVAACGRAGGSSGRRLQQGADKPGSLRPAWRCGPGAAGRIGPAAPGPAVAAARLVYAHLPTSRLSFFCSFPRSPQPQSTPLSLLLHLSPSPPFVPALLPSSPPPLFSPFAHTRTLVLTSSLPLPRSPVPPQAHFPSLWPHAHPRLPLSQKSPLKSQIGPPPVVLPLQM